MDQEQRAPKPFGSPSYYVRVDFGQLEINLNVKGLPSTPAGDSAVLARIEQTLAAVIKQGENIMSKISDYADAVQADYAKVGENLDNLAADVKALDDKITELQNSPDRVTPEDQARLDSLQTLSKALVTKTQALADSHPEPPPAPPA